MWQRWNGTTKIFEKSTDNGANWTPLGLDAAIITQGILSLQSRLNFAANGASAAASIFKTAADGIVIYGATGSGNDILVLNGAGSTVINVPTGTTNVTIAGLLTLTAGKIKFPAAQSASSDANTLDDYEEGTWTPVIGGSGGESGQAYNHQTGNYVKCGRLCIAPFDVQLSTLGTITGIVLLKGLPFNVLAGHGNSFGYFDSLNTNYVYLTLQPAGPGAAYAVVYGMTVAANAVGTLAQGNLTNNTRLIGAVIYMTEG